MYLELVEDCYSSGFHANAEGCRSDEAQGLPEDIGRSSMVRAPCRTPLADGGCSYSVDPRRVDGAHKHKDAAHSHRAIKG
jgi:hypothetical protein